MRTELNLKVETLIEGWEKTPEPMRQEGLRWYQLAHETCSQIAQDHSVPLSTVAAITSALSPGLSWDDNLSWTGHVLEHSLLYSEIKPSLWTGFQGYRRSILKAWEISKSEVDPLSFFDPLEAPKTRNFYLNLLNPSLTEPVTIDRHAGRFLLGEPTGGWAPIQIRRGLYEKFASVYRSAAHQLGLIPHQLQASLWLLQRSGVYLANEFKS